MNDDVKALVNELNADAEPGFCTSSTSTLSRRAAAALTAQAEEIDSLKAANLVLISEHPGKNYPTSEVTKDEAIAMLQRRVTAQAEEIERLRARLEITDEITERYDGIACRDETIRLLEQKIAALKAAQEVKA